MLQLIKKCKEKDGEALEELIKCFEAYIYKISASFYIKGYELEDFVQIGKMALIKAVFKFDLNKNAEFKPYAFIAIKNEIKSVIRSALCKGENFQSSLNSMVSEGVEFVELLQSEEDLEEKIILREKINKLRESMAKLSKEEMEIIHWYYIQDKPLKDFVKLKNLTLSAANKRKQRTLKKLRKMMENNN